MKRKRLFILTGLISLILITSLTISSTALALNFAGDEEAVVIKEGEVIEDDLYAAAASFTLNGTVKGDLIVFAQAININGNIEGDLTAVGQIININGSVADDVRIAGQVLTVGEEASFGDDLLAGGLSIETRKGTTVGGDFVFGGAQALIMGGVAQNMIVGVGGLKLGGKIGGDVKAMIGEAAKEGAPFISSNPPVPPVPLGLTLEEGASVAGNFEYTSAEEFEIPGGIVAGEIIHKMPAKKVDIDKEVTPTAKLFGRFAPQLKRFVSLLIVGLLLAWLFFDRTKRAAAIIFAKPLPSFGFGILFIAAFFVWLIAVLIAMIIAASLFGPVGLGGLAAASVFTGLFAISLSIFFFVLLVVYVVKIFVCLMVGRFMLLKMSPQAAEGRIWPILLGIVVYIAVTAMPIVGGLINTILIITGLGAVWLLVSGLVEKRKSAVEGAASQPDLPTQAEPVS